MEINSILFYSIVYLFTAWQKMSVFLFLKTQTSSVGGKPGIFSMFDKEIYPVKPLRLEGDSQTIGTSLAGQSSKLIFDN